MKIDQNWDHVQGQEGLGEHTGLGDKCSPLFKRKGEQMGGIGAVSDEKR